MKKFLMLFALLAFVGKMSFAQGVSPVVNRTYGYDNWASPATLRAEFAQSTSSGVYTMTAYVDGRPFPPGVSIKSIVVNYQLTGKSSADDGGGFAELDYQDDGVFVDLGDLNWSLYSKVELEWYVEFTDNSSYDDIIWDYYNPY